MTLPFVALAVVVVLGTGGLGRAAVQCQDAARTGARLAARGEAEAVVQAGASAGAPAEASVTVSRRADGLVEIEVAAVLPVVADGPWPGGRVPLSCRAAAWSEPGSAGPPAAEPGVGSR